MLIWGSIGYCSSGIKATLYRCGVCGHIMQRLIVCSPVFQLNISLKRGAVSKYAIGDDVKKLDDVIM